MDTEQFNDFEEATTPSQSLQPTSYQLSPSPPQQQTANNIQPDQPLGQIALQPSYSMITDVPTIQTSGDNHYDQEASVWPNLVKMESDHLAQVGHMELDFTKRKSEGEMAKPLPDYTQALLQDNEQRNEHSNVASFNTQQPTDQYFENIVKPSFNTEVNYHGPSVQKESARSEIVQVEFGGNLVEKEAGHKESDEFDDFKQAEEVVVDGLEIVGTQKIQIQSSNIQSQFNQGLYIQNKENKAQQELQQQLQSPMINGQQTAHLTPLTQSPEERQCSGQEQVGKTKLQDDQDQFGDFQETAPSQEQPEPKHQPIQEQLSGGNKVEMESSKGAVGTQMAVRERQLQQFVDSLPDFSFVLREGFSAL